MSRRRRYPPVDVTERPAFASAPADRDAPERGVARGGGGRRGGDRAVPARHRAGPCAGRARHEPLAARGALRERRAAAGRKVAVVSEYELPPDRVASMSDAQLIDVREDYEHDAGHIPGSRHADVNDLNGVADSLDRSKPVVFYCRSGDRSIMPAQAFRASGWDAYAIEGGLTAWVEAGEPLEPEDGEVAHRRVGPQT